ncbi:hypothetical protein MY04_0254 [Flammeovirga sp. MY04]|uniref:hypothetical protein n=1 Tax=Flammeovirga sp. MY04 TaxID=1191459 RepID=UPI000823FE11|nr:hypothetical protein [Flammeovirga sp. MY04]ANQ47636.2 hypothetical protein MY04_0254 [Flammeovirga sp. MY04]
MARLKHIVKQLSEKDYESIRTSLVDSNADKSAYLLSSMREKKASDQQIMNELDVNTNAYYTLRSRLNQKIEDYLLQQMESPRADLLKKVANIHEMVFTKKRAISIVTLKKLEKELLDYDLSNELTVVYKALKRLHINSPDFFNYSQLYNKHVAYMLAVDKIEDILADYFKKFGVYAFTGDEADKMGLDLLHQEIKNTCKLYESHRPFVYQSCMSIFHRLFIEDERQVAINAVNHVDEEEPIEDIFHKIDQIFDQYHMDSIYYHMNNVFQFLKLEYYTHYGVFRKASKYFDAVNEDVQALLMHSGQYTFPSQFLQTKMQRALQTETQGELFEQNKITFDDFEPDINDIPNYVSYIVYRAISAYYSGEFDEAARFLNNLLNEISLKKYPHAFLEVKCLLALQYVCIRDFELFNQLANSIQRQIRLMGKESCPSITLFLKMLKTGMSEAKRDKMSKVSNIITRYTQIKSPYIFAPTRTIRMDDRFIRLVSGEMEN